MNHSDVRSDMKSGLKPIFMLTIASLLLILFMISGVFAASNNVKLVIDNSSTPDQSKDVVLSLHLLSSLDVNNNSGLKNNVESSLDNIDFTSIYSLTVLKRGIDSSNDDSFRYFGNLQFPISYTIHDAGHYTFRLSKISDGSTVSEAYFDKGMVLKNLSVNVSASNVSINISSGNVSTNVSSIGSNLSINTSVNMPVTSNVSNGTFSAFDTCSHAFVGLERSEYLMGEDVKISFGNIYGNDVRADLAIVTGEATYKFVGDLKDAVFVPLELGKHSIILECGNNVVFNKSFDVVEKLSRNDSSDVVSSDYVKDSSGRISRTFTIKDSSGSSISRNALISNLSNHTIKRARQNIDIISKHSSNSLKASSSVLSNGLGAENIVENVRSLNVSSNITSNTSLNISADNSSNDSFEYVSVEVADSVQISLSETGIESSSMTLKDLVLDPNADSNFYVEDISRKDVSFDGNVVSSFAMDLSNLNFTNGTFSKTASGKELWKCAQWDYDGQYCAGSWIKVMDITPGLDYNIEISAADPGYIETGAATVNTLKSLYYPNETVDILMVVLDKKGYLVSGADVTLTVVSPDNSSRSFRGENISIISKGVYAARFLDTSLVGNYSMIVRALDNGVNSTMVSSFTVMSNHTFDIHRNSFLTIDPNDELFETSITVTANIPVSTFDYVETVPSSFEIVNVSGGVSHDIVTVGTIKKITWYGLSSGSTISYKAQTPLDTPEVYTIGPGMVKYNYYSTDDEFIEARPWILAIDPVFRGKFFMLWDDVSDEPPGWTCVSCNPGEPFYERFIMGGLNYGVTGGTISHDHTATYVGETQGANQSGASSGGANSYYTASDNHAHNGLNQVRITNASNYPSFRQLKIIAYNGVGIPLIIPAGAIAIFNTSSMPANWTQYTAENGYFIFANATVNTTGGSNTHNHTVNMTLSTSPGGTGAGTTRTRDIASRTNVANLTHIHTALGNTDVDTTIPPYINVVLAKANVNTSIPYDQGFIGMFNGSLGDGWVNVSQSGQPFNNRIIRANATYGTTGGLNFSNHANAVITTAPTPNISTTGTGTGRAFSFVTHTHDVTVSFTNTNITPPYITVVFGYAQALIYDPPTISSVQCLRAGAAWTLCSNIGYGHNLTAIRVSTSPNSPYPISNVSLVLQNIDHNRTYFNTTITSNTTAYWTYNLSGIGGLSIGDSGNYSLDILSVENSRSTFLETNWTVPWGRIDVRVIYPTSSINVTRYRTFNFTVNLSCMVGECGNVTIALDPTPPWWDNNWPYRKQINVTNSIASIIKQNYSVNISLDTTGDKFLDNGSDVRIAYYNGTGWVELDRVNESAFNSTNTQIWFKIQSNIAANSFDDDYYVYYGHDGAGSPPENKSKVYLWFDDFNRANVNITTQGQYRSFGFANWSIVNNMLRVSNASGLINKLYIMSLGNISDDVDMKVKFNSSAFNAADAGRFGLSQRMNASAWGYNSLIHSSLTTANLQIYNDIATVSASTNFAILLNSNYYMRYQSINSTTPSGRTRVWPDNISEPPGWNVSATYGGTVRTGSGYVGFAGPNNDLTIVYFDDLQIRLVVATEPSTRLYSEQFDKGIVPMASGTPFYTINTNPVYSANSSCLVNMAAGTSCLFNWTVNATGTPFSTWPFYTIANSSLDPLVAQNISARFNVTILGNIPPFVNFVSIYPLEPAYYEDLNCSFSLSDSNIGDPLSATIRWYKNGGFETTQTINSITDGTTYTAVLSSGSSFNIGDVWNCGVNPYDTQVYGPELNSSNVTILASVPPKVNMVSCLRNNAVWVPCTTIVFNNTISKMRVNCTSRLSTPVSVAFNLTNMEDHYSFFYGTTSDNSSGLWVFDNPDVLVTDSGTFNITASCTDINGTVGTNITNWLVPWGILNVTLINPSRDANETQNKYFNFTAQVRCVGGECGYINATIDPVNWWNTSWNYRRTINMTERANRTLTDYQFNVTVNTQALIAAGKMNANCSDIRFTTNNTPSGLLPYWNETACNSPNTLIWVKYNLSALSYNEIYMYYGNPAAENYSNPWNTLFLYEDMQTSPTDSSKPLPGTILGDAKYDPYLHCMNMTAAVNYQAGWIYYPVNGTEIGPGFYSSYETLAGGGNGADATYMAMYDTVRNLTEDIVSGGYHFTVDEYQRSATTDRIAFTKSVADNGQSLAQYRPPTVQLDDNRWHLLEIYFYMNGTMANASIYYNGTLVVTGNDSNPQNIAAGKFFAFGARTGGLNNNHKIGIIHVRKFVRPEPLIGIETEIKQVKGDIPMGSGDPFYTITANPMYSTNTSCLANMKYGDICNTTWTINSTGITGVPWEFFVTYTSMNYSAYGVVNVTPRINITIVGNSAPNVSYIYLGPVAPLPTENLNCSFNIFDTNAPDILSANITWYRNNVVYSRLVVNVTNGVLASTILGFGNITLGESWKCGVQPFDQLLYGNQINSSNLTIVNSKPPVINKIECQINGTATWTNCSKLGYGSNLSAVRVNCTTNYQRIANVTINFSNTPDGKTFFVNTTWSNATYYWYSYRNVTINDSGEFVVSANCMNNESAYDFEVDNWTVPWGRVSVVLINPNTDGYVESNRFFNFTAQVRCLGGECGNVTAILDPADVDPMIQSLLSSQGTNSGGINSVSMTQSMTNSYKPMKMIVETSGYDTQTIDAYNYYQSKYLIDGQKYSTIPSGKKYAGNPKYPDGLMTVNTNKDSYRIGEKAMITVVSLDSKGNFNDDNISITLMTPDGDDILLDDVDQSDIVGMHMTRLAQGVYSMTTDALSDVGEYLLIVKSSDGRIGSSSRFIVKDNVDYEIIRDAPLAVNPWAGSDGMFNTTISVKILDSRYNDAPASFTEIIPSNIAIIDAGGGSIWKRTVDDVERTYITWNDIVGKSKVSYIAKPEKISPDKIELKSFISVKGKIFDEYRPWIIAVDPTNYYTAYNSSFRWYSTSGGSTAGTEGGDYSDTIVRDCSGGTCTSSNSYVAGIANFPGNGANCRMNVTLLFNISGIKPEYVENMTVRWGGCWNGDGNLGANKCNGNNPPGFGSPTGYYSGTFTMYIFRNTTPITADCISTVGGECMVDDSVDLGSAAQSPSWGLAHAYHDFTFQKTSLDSVYLNNSIMRLMWQTWGEGSCGNGANTNILLDIDYANLSIGWNYIIKNGSMVSMVSGTDPFYTVTANPNYPANSTCLAWMGMGSTCNITWSVNASGGVNTTHVFYVTGNVSNYNSTVDNNASASIKLTIRDTTAVPPSVTLNRPSPGLWTPNSTMMFNCSATDNNGLVSLSFYNNFTGSFASDETVSVSGLSASANFTRSMTEGVFVWNCLALDNDNNERSANSNRTITIDYTPPSISLLAPMNNDNLDSRNVQFNFSVADNLDSSMICNLTIDDIVNLSGFAAGNGANISKSVYNLSNGPHHWNVTCTDEAGNSNTSDTYLFTVLSTPPVVVLQTIDNFMTNQSNFDLYYFTDDGGRVVSADLYINGLWNQTDSDPTTGSSNLFSMTNVPEGSYNWTVNVTNDAGLTSQAAVRYFIVSFSAPSINLSFPPNYYLTNSSSMTFNFTATDKFDPVLTCKITINNVDVAVGINANNGTPTTRTVNNLANGPNYWNMTCQNDAGNVNRSETRVFNVSAPPTIGLNNPGDNTWQKLVNITLYYTPSASGNITNCTLIINGARNYTNYTISKGVQNNFKLVNLNEGLYNWSVNCTDQANVTGSSPNRVFTIDYTGPTITPNYPKMGNVVYGGVTMFNFTVIDNYDPVLVCNLYIDGSLNKSGISANNGEDTNLSVAITVEGNHSWYVNCSDNNFNYNSSLVQNFSTVNAPTVNLIYPAPNAFLNFTNNVNFTFNPSSSNPLINATLYINNVLNQTMNGPSPGVENRFFANFTNGVYNWSIRITDNVGLIGISLNRTFTIDTVKPTVNIMTPNNTLVVTTNNVTFKFNVTDNIAGNISCNVTVSGVREWENISLTTGSVVTRYKIMGDGSYNWSVNCGDAAGNRNDFVLTNFTVLAPPNVTLVFPGPGFRTRLQNIQFNYTPVDYLGFTNCSLYINGIFNQTNSTPVVSGVANYFTVLGLVEGDYDWTVRCIDAAPDLNPYTATLRNFTIDQTPPTITMIYPEVNGGVNTNNVRFNWTATDYAVNLVCMLYVDGNYNTTVTQMSGTYFTPLVTNFTSGAHNWSLNCSDDLNNSILSPVWNFTISDADLFLNTTRITFNNSNPDENQSITIFANVSNIGGVPATNVNVSFWDEVNAVRTYLGSSISTVNSGSYRMFNVTWNITNGYHTIYVAVDPDNLVVELNNDNNNASTNISILRSVIDSPASGLNVTDSSLNLFFTLTDYTTGTNNIFYNIYIGSSNMYSDWASDSVQTMWTLPLNEGTNNIRVEAIDSLNRRKNSSIVTVYLDTTRPAINYATSNPPDNRVQNDSNFTINVTHTEAHPDKIILYWKEQSNSTYNSSDIRNYTGTAGGYTNFTLFGLPDGIYQYYVWLNDTFGWPNQTVQRTLRVDLNPPIINLMSPANGGTVYSSAVELSFNVSDSSRFVNCTLYIDGVANKTISNFSTWTAQYFAQLFNDGTYSWNINCSDQFNRTAVSATRTFTVQNVNPTWSGIWYETYTSNWENITALINLASLRDGVENNNIINITGGSLSTMAVATSSLLGGHGLLVPSGTTVNFSGVFSTGRNGNGYVTWKLYVTNESGDYLVAQSGTDSTGPNNIPNDARSTVANDSSIGALRLGPLDRFKFVIDIYNSGAKQDFTHFWDDRAKSWFALNKFYVPGDANVSLVEPNDTIMVAPGYVFNQTCEVRCEYGTCMNTYVYAQYNSSMPLVNNWTNISAAGYLRLGAGQQNGIYVGNVSYTDRVNVTFVINTTSASYNNIRCFVKTDYNTQIGSEVQSISVADMISPTVIFDSPGNASFRSNSTTIFYFNASDNIALDVCEFYLDGSLDQSKDSSQLVNNARNNFTKSGMLEGVHYWNVSCNDTSGNVGTTNYSRVFTIDYTAPILVMLTPQNGNNSFSSSLNFSFNVTDNIASSLKCNLTLDNVVVRTNAVALNGTPYSTIITNLAEGTHYWNVTCFDNASNTNISNTWTFNVFNAPVITLASPANNYWTNESTVMFYFNVSDESGIENCSLMLYNGVALSVFTKTNAQIIDNATNNITATGLNGVYNWSVGCYDNSTMHIYAVTANRTIYVDLYPPAVNFTTPNGTWFNTTTPVIRFNITDNLDTVLNYTVYVDGLYDSNGTSNNGQIKSVTLQTLAEGMHNVTVEAFDHTLNRINSTNLTIYVDITVPVVRLNSPANGFVNTNKGTVSFAFRVTDNLAANLTCSINISGGFNFGNLTAANGVPYNIVVENLTGGVHFWNVTCYDYAGNFNSSLTRNFTIPKPDLFVNSTDIVFTPSNPVEGQNVSVNVTIHNLGANDALNFTVQIFSGNPYAGGTQLQNYTINLLAGDNTSFALNFTANLGLNMISVILDPPLATNGTVNEEDESNNMANNTAYVSTWQYILGISNDTLVMADNSSIDLFTWYYSNATGSNVYVADTDNNISWYRLKPIGMNMSNLTSIGDFAAIDTALSSTNYSDSVNRTYTTAGSMNAVAPFTSYGRMLDSVPVANSTNTSNFMTGILWDYSDSNPGRYSGTQDLIFVTKMNKGVGGYNGTVDFEIRVPARLRDYKGSTSTVSLYVELR